MVSILLSSRNAWSGHLAPKNAVLFTSETDYVHHAVLLSTAKKASGRTTPTRGVALDGIGGHKHPTRARLHTVGKLCDAVSSIRHVGGWESSAHLSIVVVWDIFFSRSSQ